MQHKSPQAVRRAIHCDAQTLPYFVVERNTVTPPKVSRGGELRHILIYSMCPMPNGTTVPGKLVRRIKLGNETILEDVTEAFELKAGQWILTALVRVPPGASVGTYAFATEIRAGTLRYDGERRFEIKEGK
jgi:hypothetical protein